MQTCGNEQIDTELVNRIIIEMHNTPALWGVVLFKVKGNANFGRKRLRTADLHVKQ